VQKQATQAELDDLLMVFGDLEDKLTRYKVSRVWGEKALLAGEIDAYLPRGVTPANGHVHTLGAAEGSRGINIRRRRKR